MNLHDVTTLDSNLHRSLPVCVVPPSRISRGPFGPFPRLLSALLGGDAGGDEAPPLLFGLSTKETLAPGSGRAPPPVFLGKEVKV